MEKMKFQIKVQVIKNKILQSYLLDTIIPAIKFPDAFGFLCLFNISEYPLEFREDRPKDRHTLTEVRATERAQYIADAMKNAKKNQLFFAPYNAKIHWMLCVIHPFKEIVYWFDPLGFAVRDDIKRVVETGMKIWIAHNNLSRSKKSIKWIEVKRPRQTNNTDCGYYILRYMLDIMRRKDDSTPCYPEPYGSKTFIKADRSGSRSVAYFCAGVHDLYLRKTFSLHYLGDFVY